MFGTQFWFFNLIAPIIIVEDLHHSYILNKKKKKKFIFLSYYILSPQIPQIQLNFYTYPPPSLLPLPTNPPPYSSPLLHFFTLFPFCLSPCLPFLSKTQAHHFSHTVKPQPASIVFFRVCFDRIATLRFPLCKAIKPTKPIPHPPIYKAIKPIRSAPHLQIPMIST